jgi:C1A family cysteine protease
MGKIAGFKKIDPHSDDDIKRAILCYGPLAVCSDIQVHCFLIVGWDDDMLLNEHGKKDWPTKGRWIKKDNRGIGYGNKGFGSLPYDHGFTDFKNETYAITGYTSIPPNWVWNP